MNNIGIFSGGLQRDSAINIHITILPQTVHPSRLTHVIDQYLLCYTVEAHWLSILNIAMCNC